MKSAKKSIFSQLIRRLASSWLAGANLSLASQLRLLGSKNGESQIEGFMDNSEPDFVRGGANRPRYGEDLATAIDLELHGHTVKCHEWYHDLNFNNESFAKEGSFKFGS